MTLAYENGWPVCPECLKARLVSTLKDRTQRNGTGEIEPRPPRPTDEMRCPNCGWSGCVPTLAEARRARLVTHEVHL